MSDVGTGYGTMKRAIIDKLEQRAGLQGVRVAYDAPVKAVDVKGPTGRWESIYFADNPETEGEHENRIICALPLTIEEKFTLPLMIVTLLPVSDGSQEAADTRVDELLFEVLHELAHDPTFGLGATISETRFQVLQCTKAPSWSRRTGHLNQGHGAACILELEVESRLTFYN